MAEVNTDIYRQQNPLGQLGNVLGVLNAGQQFQQNQIAVQRQQLELQQGYAKGLYDTIAPLVNVPGITQAQVRAAAANYARQVGIPPQAHANFDAMLSGPDWKTNLGNLAVRTIGPEGILRREEITDTTGAKRTIPSTSVISGALPTSVPLTTGPSIQKMQADLTSAGNFNQTIVPWMQMHHELNALPEGSTGPLTTGLLHTVEGIHSLAPGLLKYLPGNKIEDMTNRAAFAKYAAQAANNIGGKGTDLSLMQTITGNPNPSINDLTDKQLVRFGIAVQRMGAAQTLEASKADIRDPQGKIIGKGPVGSNGPDYITKFGVLGNQMDPRGFMLDLLPPEEVTKLHKSIKSKEERNKINRSFKFGLDNQFYGLPGQ